ncbi:hypothetical protein [Spirosoma oryzicola]|uniref:hypothetical protein n=1 Tax=Spirosoma oryzicola TaxID=2898794 RepID=UPI001E5849A5|nr:hypothetical protein [Spirosoma oryzicola]UHG91831.1 hypothetical protein LQ777_02775 [Spirosoma oryzicola]
MRNFYTTIGLLLTISASAQPRVSVDSVAIFSIAEDQYSQGKGLLRAKGFISQFKAHEDGHVDVSVFRQHVGYLSAEKGYGVKNGPNTIPALFRLGYQEGHLQPLGEQFVSLTSGLKKPFSYHFQTIIGLTGGVQTETKDLTDNVTATDYARLLQEQTSALGYRGDVTNLTSAAVQNNNFVVQKTPYQYVPYSNRYLPVGQPTSRTYPLDTRQSPTHIVFANQGTMTYHQPQANQLITLDTLGRTLHSLALDGLSGKRVWAITDVVDENTAAIVTAGELQQRVGADWLFGPDENKAKNPELVLIRTDAQGKLVFRHNFTVSHEDYGMTQAAIVSNATDALVNVTMGKGLLKYEVAYAKINAKGVVFQRIWDKKNAAQIVRVNGSNGIFKAFSDSRHLVNLPNGESLVISYDANQASSKGTSALIGYGALHLSAGGDLTRYYGIKATTPAALDAPLPTLRVFSQPDGRVMLWVNEARNAQASQFSAFSLLDNELQSGGLSNSVGGSNGQPSVLANRTTNGIRPASSPLSEAGGFIGGLGRLADRAAATRNALGLDRQSTEAKQQEQMETNPFNTAPMLYWLDTQSGTVLVRDFALLNGYSLPNQPFVVFNRSRNEAYVPLRTSLQSAGQSKAMRYPQAVYFKLARMTW